MKLRHLNAFISVMVYASGVGPLTFDGCNGEFLICDDILKYSR